MRASCTTMQPSSSTWSWMIWLAESNPAGSTTLATCSWPLPRVDASSKHPTSNAHQEERRKLLLYEPRNRFVPQPSCHDYILGWKRNPVHSQLLIQAAIELSQTADTPFTFLFTSLKKPTRKSTFTNHKHILPGDYLLHRLSLVVHANICNV